MSLRRHRNVRTRIAAQRCKDCQHWQQTNAVTIGKCTAVENLKIACDDEPCDIGKFKLKV